MISAIHILLVEDNAADVDLTREALASTKFDIKLSVAKDGVEAIDFLNGAGTWSEPGHPTLILLDLNLPRKDGRQVLAVIKGHDEFRRIPVVILSSSVPIATSSNRSSCALTGQS
jgi:two-component system response regulator